MRPPPILLAVIVAALLAPLAARGEDAPPVAPDLAARPPPASAPPPPAAMLAAAEAPAPAPAAAKREHGFFPIWGDKVRAKGFDLPEPFGFMVNYYYQRSDIEIANLKLGFNDRPMQDVSGLIQVPAATTKASALAIRPNVMVFPFLSLYAVFSSGATETNVSVQTSDPLPPLQFSTLAKSGAQVLALGATFQMGYKGFFGVADFNGSVADVERLADAVGTNLLSFRLGYNQRLGATPGRGIALWAGTAGQVIDVATEGSVRLSSVLPPPSGAAIDQAQARCDALRPNDPRKEPCNQIVQGLRDLSNGVQDSTVHYALDKKPAGVWNMVLGAQYALDRQWQFRFETTFLNGRTSFLAATEYRFDIL